MADQKHEKVHVSSQTSGEKKPEGYKLSDFQQLYEDAKPNSWKDLENYIDKKSDSQWHITPGEAKSMKADVQRAEKQGKPFTKDPKKAYEEVHG